MTNKYPYIFTFIYTVVTMTFPFLIWISLQAALPEYIYNGKFTICVLFMSVVSAAYYLVRAYKFKRIKVTYENIWINIISAVVLYFYYVLIIRLLHIKASVADYNILNYIFAVYLFVLLSDACLCVSCRHSSDEKYKKHPANPPITDNNFNGIEIGYPKSKIRYFKNFAERVGTNKYFKFLSLLNLFIALPVLYFIYPIPRILF